MDARLETIQLAKGPLTILILGIVLSVLSPHSLAEPPLRISEFCASNIDSLADHEGDFPDWIELENTSDRSVELRAFCLTDDPTQPIKYQLPRYSLGPGDRIIIFASGKRVERVRPPYHAPFKLSSKGEYLALTEHATQTVLTEFTPNFPRQIPGVSYGLPSSPSSPPTFGFLSTPTPGQPNAGLREERRAPTLRFSKSRGLYQTPIEIELSSDSNDAVIYYTQDGSTPSARKGSRYTQAITIDRTQVVRAVAIQDDLSSPVIAHSYLFPHQVADQKQPPGFPSQWGTLPADYAMDPRLTNDERYRDQLTPALFSLPTLSLATELENLFDSNRGIYANPGEQGRDWERPVSMEWIPGTGESHQIHAGLRIQGGWFRGAEVTRKHSLRLLFKRRYGPARLKLDVFNEFGAADEFETLVLRAGANDGYSWAEARGTEQFIRDEFGRRLVLAMGWPAPRGRFVHLYLNGCYWGLYNLCERPNEDFSSTYLGGSPEDWDAINTGVAKHGTLDAWSNFKLTASRLSERAGYFALQGKNPSGMPQRRLPAVLNTAQYADYLIANMWLGNADWPDKNFWLASYRGSPPKPIQFYPWDMEIIMGNSRTRSPLNYQAPHEQAVRSGATELHYWLREFPEYRMDFADRVQKHLRQDGALTQAELRKRYLALSEQIAPAVIAEAARWGDDQTASPGTPADWFKERNWILDEYLLQRGAIVIDQLRQATLFPRVLTPVVSPTDRTLAPNEPLQLTSPETDLYYTLDGVDPRLPGGAINPAAIKATMDRSYPIYPMSTLIGLGSIWQYSTIQDLSLSPWHPNNLSDTQAWKVGFAPLGTDKGKAQTTMARTPQTPQSKQVAPFLLRKRFGYPHHSPFSKLELSLETGDAAAVFLNGQVIYRSSDSPHRSSPHPYSSRSKESVETLTVSLPPHGLLQPGSNEIVVFLFQRNDSDRAVHFDLSLVGVAMAGKNQTRLASVRPKTHGILKARAQTNGSWSALLEHPFTIDAPQARANDVVISAIAFHPAGAQTDSERAISRDARDFEFIEIMNRSDRSIDLSGAIIDGGIEFKFPQQSILSSGQRWIIPRSQVAFRARHGNNDSVVGEFSGRLNNKGESLSLKNGDGSIIDTVSFSTDASWPIANSEPGYRLQRILLPSLTVGTTPESWERQHEQR